MFCNARGETDQAKLTNYKQINCGNACCRWFQNLLLSLLQFGDVEI